MDRSEQRQAMRSLVDLWTRLEAIARQAMPEATEEEIGEATGKAAARILRIEEA